MLGVITEYLPETVEHMAKMENGRVVKVDLFVTASIFNLAAEVTHEKCNEVGESVVGKSFDMDLSISPTYGAYCPTSDEFRWTEEGEAVNESAMVARERQIEAFKSSKAHILKLERELEKMFVKLYEPGQAVMICTRNMTEPTEVKVLAVSVHDMTLLVQNQVTGKSYWVKHHNILELD